MICPNCGRELPENARTCPGCMATQRLRRRRIDIDIPKDSSIRVERSVKPDEQTTMSKHERSNGSSALGGTGDWHAPASQVSIPAGSRVFSNVGAVYPPPKAITKGQMRRVRRAPEHKRRRLDCEPLVMQPPIYQKSYKRLTRILFVVLLLTVFVCCAGGYFLFSSESGQRMMAQWGWSIARTDAYVTLGRDLYNQAYYDRALEALQVAVNREPQNVDALILMGQTYTELGEIDKATQIYEALITDIAPAHPSAYRNLIKIYQQQGYNAEALELMRRASANAGSQEFDVMLREYTPKSPTLSHQEGRYPEAIDVTISIPSGETVYYTIDGTDPSDSGLVYEEGTLIHIPEGKTTIKAIGFTENGTPSEQIEAIFTVIIPTPAAPKSNVKSGVYTYAPKVSLRPGGETKEEQESIAAIYYTIDGRAPTTDSTLYTDPIQLPIGKSTLRAIALGKNGKISYEMNVTYEVKGNLKKTFSSADTFKNMELYKTGYKAFTKDYGAPDSYEPLPVEEWYSPQMQSYEATYAWGTARFLKKSEDASPVLYALDTTSTAMTGPRSTKIGMSSTDVIGKFQDLGQAALDSDGNRLLYNISTQTMPAGMQFGTFRKEEDGNYAIHYYYPVDEKHTIFVELSYYLDAQGSVMRIVWQRYLSELT